MLGRRTSVWEKEGECRLPPARGKRLSEEKKDRAKKIARFEKKKKRSFRKTRFPEEEKKKHTHLWVDKKKGRTGIRRSRGTSRPK